MDDPILIRFNFHDRIFVKIPPTRWEALNVKLLPLFHGMLGAYFEPSRKVWSFTDCPKNRRLLSDSLNPYLSEVNPTSPYFSSSDENRLIEELHARKYSPRTIKLYCNANKSFHGYVKKRPKDVTKEDVTKFLAYKEKIKHASASTLNIFLSAIRFYHSTILGRDLTEDRKRPKSDRRLPIVLSKEEVATILSATSNIKHRLLLTLCYSGGLRVSEIVSLKCEDLDFSRGTVYIRRAKGRKDRYTLLSQKVAELLKQYIDLYHPTHWLFEGRIPSEHSSIRTAQRVFEIALERSDVKKSISIHCLRHSFATHLLETGTDIRYIQELLGHASTKTTQIYTHVARGTVLRIHSPLDDIDA